MKIAVIGAGIAGVAVAELLQRYPENRVTLIESQNQVGAGASMDQHGWFHTGCLYSILNLEKNIESAIKNLRTVSRYYKSYLDQAAHGHRRSWFVDEPISYLFPNQSSLAYRAADAGSIEKLQSFAEFSVKTSSAVSELRKLSGMAEIKAGLKVVSSDLPMRTKVILSDLISSFQCNGGELRLSSRCVSHASTIRGVVNILLADGSSVDVDRCIICSGAQLASSVVDGDGLIVRRSPVLVIVPALCRENIVVVEDESHPSFSHIVHHHNGQKYSVVSGSYSADEGDIDGMRRASLSLMNVTKSHFPYTLELSSRQIYCGTKVDRVASGSKRNYSPLCINLDQNVIGAIPGKFSFAFLLAHDLALRIMDGKNIPLSTISSPRHNASLVATSKHELVAAELFRDRWHVDVARG